VTCPEAALAASGRRIGWPDDETDLAGRSGAV